MRAFSLLRSAISTFKSGLQRNGKLFSTDATAANNPIDSVDSVKEGVLWFDNLYPKKVHPLDFRWVFAKSASERRLKRIVGKENVEITNIIPRSKEGGAYVHFRSKYPIKKVEEILMRDLREHRERSLFVPQEIRTHLVQGEPFLEDMVSRYPSSRIRINYIGPELPQEELFHHFRSFGKINDIIIPPIVKDQPRFATIIFKRYHGGVSARNCMHRATIGDTKLLITYEEILKTSMISDFINKHSKIAIPLIGLAIATITYLVFDPIRVFFITNKVTGRFDILDSEFLQQYFPQQVESLKNYFHSIYRRHYGMNTAHTNLTALNVSEEDVNRIRMKVRQSPGSVLFVVGLKGSGKRAATVEALKNRKNVLMIDCNYLLSLSSEEVVPNFCRMVGCLPGFTFLKYATMLTDTILGAGGAKSGSSQMSTQVHKILECLSIALSRLSRTRTSGEDLHGTIPVVIIDGARHDNRDKHEKFFDMLLEWAAFAAENQLAHVIFLTDSSVAVDSQNKAFVGHRSDVMVLHEVPADIAINTTTQLLNVKITPEESAKLQVLGGRLSDLFTVVSKIRNGVSVHGNLPYLHNQKMSVSPEKGVISLIIKCLVSLKIIVHTFPENMHCALFQNHN
eukprot:TRINITY_DN6304_c0_g1_i1.p1 TRINITY_DN6304_c0_g1~~TRINITY_DN6304_c0_g1_i1.p1  ORF type:complete len:624 (+),score=104.22 TRINITY_DN6304_c0_g1_i1:53-1924(+)